MNYELTVVFVNVLWLIQNIISNSNLYVRITIKPVLFFVHFFVYVIIAIHSRVNKFLITSLTLEGFLIIDLLMTSQMCENWPLK